MGYKILKFSMACLVAEVKAVMKLLKNLKDAGTDEGFMENMVSMDEYFELVGAEKYGELDARYLKG